MPTRLFRFLPRKSLATAALCLAVCGIGLASTSSYFLDTSRLELQVTPPAQTVSGVVKVSSNSSRKLRLRVLPKLWRLTPQGVLVYQNAPTEGFNLLDNIGINPREFDLLPGKSRLVRFVVKTPEQAKDAEYPFQLYFEPVSLLEENSAAESRGVHNVLDVVPVFTTTVYVYKGHPKPDVKVEKLTCAYEPKQGRFNVNLEVENEGDKHARLFGNLLLFAGQDAAKPLDVLHMQNSTLIIVFPGARRVVENSLAPTAPLRLKPGAYRMELQLVDERNVQPSVQSTCHFSVNEGK